MIEPLVPDALLVAIRAGGEALDRGERGPAIEIERLHEAGLLRAPLPLEQGGRGWGTSAGAADAICHVLMALGGAGLPIARLYEGHVNAVRLVQAFGDDAQRQRVAESVQGGTLMGVWGADSEQPVAIEGDSDSARLSGVKVFASGLGLVGIAIVTARELHGLQMVLVDAGDPLRADHADWDVDGMVGSHSGRFSCAGLPASGGARLGPRDALFVEPDFHGGVWRIAACYAGAMARIAQLGAAGLIRRGQVDAPAMRSRLGMMAIEAETAALWARSAAALVEAGNGDADKAVSAALFAREAVERAAVRLLATVERMAGTAMHRRDSEIGRMARDLRFYLRQADLDGKLALATGHWLGSVREALSL